MTAPLFQPKDFRNFEVCHRDSYSGEALTISGERELALELNERLAPLVTALEALLLAAVDCDFDEVSGEVTAVLGEWKKLRPDGHS